MNGLNSILTRLAGEEYCYLTTTGRVSGKPHELEIWFALENQTIYLLSGGGYKSDWVKNLLKDPAVTVRIAQHRVQGTARLVKEIREETIARTRLARKYGENNADGSLSEWAQTALPVAIDLIEG